MKAKEVFFFGLGVLIVLGFFVVLGLMIFKGADPTTTSLLIGALITAFATVVGYFYGSSKGSSEKDQMLLNTKPNDTNT